MQEAVRGEIANGRGNARTLNHSPLFADSSGAHSPECLRSIGGRVSTSDAAKKAGIGETLPGTAVSYPLLVLNCRSSLTSKHAILSLARNP